MAEVARHSVGAPSGRPASPLLGAKLRPPLVPEHYVRRERLLQMLDGVGHAPLTLVVAPAGVGKTVLLAGWAAESKVPTCWLSLDEADRDGRQLWAGVIAALATLWPRCGEAALTMLHRRDPVAAVVARLLDDLEAEPGPPSVLVIDDLHVVVDDEAVFAPLALFLLHLPRSLHVVLLSRRSPDLPIDRLRARGQLDEIRFAELSFSHEESCEMLSRLTPTLSDEQIGAAATRAGGWAAGLQLAALGARADRAHLPVGAPRAESDLLIDDYVWREVLAGEDAELVEVLLDVAVMDRTNASLASALAGREDAGDLLLRAEARGLFVARLGPEGWFALHFLVRSVLLAELERRSPARLAEQHGRAARWLEDVGEVPAALDHWLLADRPLEALRLLAAKNGELYDSGREVTIRRTIARLPPELAVADVGSLLELAWCHTLVDRRRFVELLEQAAWLADRSGIDQAHRARLTTLRSIAATMSGDWAAGGELARRALQDLGDAWWRDPLGRFAWNMVAREWALSERWDDAGDDVREATLALGHDPERRLSFEGTRALGEALAGRPADALRVAAGVRRAADVANMTILRAELALAEAVAHRELGDRERALPALAALAETPAETMLYCRILAALELAQALLDEADLEGARQAFERAESLVETESFGPGGRQWLGRVGTQLAVSAGDIDDARRWAAEVDDGFWAGVSTARVRLAVGSRSDALSALDEAAPRCVRHEVVHGLLRARAAPDPDESARHAVAAVESASANGLLQTAATEGAALIDLIERSAWRVPSPWMASLRRAAAKGSPVARSVGAGLGEPLTARERDVLRFLASRLTVGEIADELYLSVNTLKFHLKAIYRKLGVGSRAEAAEVARRMSGLRPHA